VKREPGDSTNSGLTESGLGTVRGAKALPGCKLENATGIVAGAKAARELQQGLTALRMQTTSVKDFAKRDWLNARRMPHHEYGRKTEFTGT
jgi:hypothetical protein